MAKDRPAARVESDGLDDLIPVSHRLNTASDELNLALKQVEDRLNGLGIGVSRFVPIPGTKEFLKDGTNENPEEWFEYQVGYDRQGERWALMTRRARFIDTHNGSIKPEDRWQYSEEKPLLRSSRKLRMNAVAVIPELLKALKDEAEQKLNVVHAAREVALESGSYPDHFPPRPRDGVTADKKASCDAIDRARQHARLAVHAGAARLMVDGEFIHGLAEFVMPADSGLIIGVRSASKLTNDMATDLHITGSHEGRSFVLTAPMCYTRRPGKDIDTGWSLISPMNHHVSITYGESGMATQLRVVLNNFDYDCGDPVISANSFTRVGTPLTVELTDRKATLRRRPDYDVIYSLLRAGILRTASLIECVFDVSHETDEELLELANDVASLLTVAHGASVGVAMIEFLDDKSEVLRRIVSQPVGSRYRDDAIIQDFHLPRLFSESFAEMVKMRRSKFPWRKLPSYCGSPEDSPYIEQKFASLMMALEYFMRVSLLEHGVAEDEVAALDWNALINSVKAKLRWNVPKHYTTRDVVRLVRNAVMHGREVPLEDSAEFRLLFNKWRLFLFRRVLMRLGYRGEVICPWKGVQDTSAVDDFSEERNSFDQTEVDSHPFVQFVKYIKEQQKPAAKRGS